MNTKQILTIVLIVFLSFVSIFLIILGLYKLAPSFFGIETTTEKQETKSESETERFESEPKVVLSKKEFDEWMQKSFNSQAIATENLFLTNYTKYLLDSIGKANAQIENYRSKNVALIDSLTIISKELSKKNKQILELTNQLQLQEKQIQKFSLQLGTDLQGSGTLSDSARRAIFSTYAKIYENADPKEVAKIIELIDEKTAFEILKSMSKRKAGKVIDALKPERSARILQASFE
ncbi:MAG: hypothetical protein N2517_03300 [Ignavibacteria bacterium]|nr:hypothetical protein [Ignavibacteria bacterium]